MIFFTLILENKMCIRKTLSNNNSLHKIKNNKNHIFCYVKQYGGKKLILSSQENKQVMRVSPRNHR